MSVDRKLREAMYDQGFVFEKYIEDLQEVFGDQVAFSSPTKRVHPVMFDGSDNYDAFMKIKKFPILSQNIEWAENTFKAYLSVKNNPDFNLDNFLPLIGTEPYVFGDYRGVLMPLGITNLAAYGFDNPDMSSEEFLSIMMQSFNGLRKMHQSKYKHRDFKLSQMILDKLCSRWQDNHWMLGDYETASIKDDTTTAKNDSIFWSPEFWKNHTDKSGKISSGKVVLDEQTDIFAGGASFYMLKVLSPNGFKSFFGGGLKVSYSDYIYHTIEDSARIKSNEKYYLHHLTNPAFPGDGILPRGKKDSDFRVKSAQIMWEELSDPYSGVTQHMVPEFFSKKKSSAKDEPKSKSFKNIFQSEKKAIITPPPPPKPVDPKDTAFYKDFMVLYKSAEKELSSALRSGRDALGFLEGKKAYDLYQLVHDVQASSNKNELAGLADVEEKSGYLVNTHRDKLLFPERDIIKKELVRFKKILKLNSSEARLNEMRKIRNNFFSALQRAEMYSQSDLDLMQESNETYSYNQVSSNKTPFLEEITAEFNKFIGK